jgi:hypothetical protein
LYIKNTLCNSVSVNAIQSQIQSNSVPSVFSLPLCTFVISKLSRAILDKFKDLHMCTS